MVDGASTGQVLLGARELFQSGLDDAAQNWVNRSVIYTHGYGAVMSTATTFSESGQPDFIVRDVPPTGAFEITQPRVYYGEAYGIDEAEYIDRLNLDPDVAAEVRPRHRHERRHRREHERAAVRPPRRGGDGEPRVHRPLRRERRRAAEQFLPAAPSTRGSCSTSTSCSAASSRRRARCSTAAISGSASARSRRSSNSTTTRTSSSTTDACTGYRTRSPRPTASPTPAASTAAGWASTATSPVSSARSTTSATV